MVIVICSDRCGIIGTCRRGWIDKKVAAIIRVPVRRSVIPVEVREPVVPSIVPIAAQTDSPDSVRVHEVGAASSVPDFRLWFTRGLCPLSLRDSPLTGRRKGRRQKSRTRPTERKARRSTRTRRTVHCTKCRPDGQPGQCTSARGRRNLRNMLSLMLRS